MQKKVKTSKYFYILIISKIKIKKVINLKIKEILKKKTY